MEDTMSRVIFETPRVQEVFPIRVSALEAASHRIYLQAVLRNLTPEGQLELLTQIQGQTIEEQTAILREACSRLIAA